MSHASIDPATRAERALPEDLIRLCVGIEDVHDLLEDLESAVCSFTMRLTADDYGRSVEVGFEKH
jgi:cystathionine beta-lyase/cystathionine gamma-synthase